MFTKNKLIIWISLIFGLFIFQTITYLTIGKSQLKHKLLPHYFASHSHSSDSVYVQDFYNSECIVGDRNVYYNQSLIGYEEELKRKLNVRFVHFMRNEDIEVADSTHKVYNIVYTVWAMRPKWNRLFGIYKAKIFESLLIDKKYSYRREGTYHWVLFFWIHRFEWFTSAKLN
jgi:hypothetical protein